MPPRPGLSLTAFHARDIIPGSDPVTNPTLKGGKAMRKYAFLIVGAFLLVLVSGLTGGEEKLGVTVYPGATFDEATGKFLAESMNLEAYCYRTNDAVAKVVAFYKGQTGLKLIDANDQGGMFKKGDVDVTIQNPWMDVKTGTMSNDTLISIVKQKS
jgi:hypothetical protein